MPRFSFDGVGLSPNEQSWKGFSGRGRGRYPFRAHAVSWAAVAAITLPMVLFVILVPIAAVLLGTVAGVVALFSTSTLRLPPLMYLIAFVAVGGFLAVNETWAAGKLINLAVVLAAVAVTGPGVADRLLNSERTVSESIHVLMAEADSPRHQAPVHRQISQPTKGRIR